MDIPLDRERAVCSCQHFLGKSSNDEIKLIKWILFSTHETLKFFVAFHHGQPIDWCRISMNIFLVSGAISTLFNASRNYRWMKHIFTNEIDEKCYFWAFLYNVQFHSPKAIPPCGIPPQKSVKQRDNHNERGREERDRERENWHFEHTYLSASIWSSTSAPPKWR